MSAPSRRDKRPKLPISQKARYRSAYNSAMSSDTTYNISQLAAEFDVTTRTIRFYEDEGLLTPLREGNRRIFNERDRVRLKLILRGKRLGFSLSEIRELFTLYDTDPGKKGQLLYLLERIDEHRGALQQQQEDIQMVLMEMDELEQQARESLQEMGHPVE